MRFPVPIIARGLRGSRGVAHRRPASFAPAKRKEARQTSDLVFYGANERIRTADLRITSALLYQLSHVGARTLSSAGMQYTQPSGNLQGIAVPHQARTSPPVSARRRACGRFAEAPVRDRAAWEPLPPTSRAAEVSVARSGRLGAARFGCAASDGAEKKRWPAEKGGSAGHSLFGQRGCPGCEQVQEGEGRPARRVNERRLSIRFGRDSSRFLCGGYTFSRFSIAHYGIAGSLPCRDILVIGALFWPLVSGASRPLLYIVLHFPLSTLVPV